MEKKNRMVNLETINNEYDFIIYDTCALCRFLQGKERSLSIDDEGDFVDFLIEKISKGYNCFLSSSVVDEYSDTRISQKERILKRGELIEVFEEHKKIIKLSLQEENLYREYIKLFPEYQEKYRVTFTDFEVFFYGLIFSEMRGPTAIVSNDINGISRIWNDVMKQSVFSREKFGFFVRKEIDLYEGF